MIVWDGIELLGSSHTAGRMSEVYSITHVWLLLVSLHVINLCVFVIWIAPVAVLTARKAGRQCEDRTSSGHHGRVVFIIIVERG
jgi:hypothetical protein